MIWFRDRRIDVQFVKNVFWLVPPVASQRFFGGNMWGQDSIVMVVIMILCFVINDINVCQPLDHTSTNVAGDDQTDRVSMIRLQSFTIGFICDQDIVCWVHGACERDGGTILDQLSPWFIRERSRADLVG